MKLPLPVTSLLRVSRAGKSEMERHLAAYLAWEASIRIAVASTADSKSGLERPSIGLWVRMLRMPTGKIADGALHDLADFLYDTTCKARGKRGKRTPKQLLNALPEYRNKMFGHMGLRDGKVHSRAADLLRSALERAWQMGWFLRADEHLVHVASVEINISGSRHGHVHDLSGEVSESGHAPIPDGVLPEQVYVRNGNGYRSVHALLHYQDAIPHGCLFFFNGSDGYFDYLTSARLPPQDIHEGIRRGFHSLLARAPREADAPCGVPKSPSRGSVAVAAGGVEESNIASLDVQAQIDALDEGATLDLRVGEFRGPVVIRRAITVDGHGAAIWAPSGPVVLVESSGVTLRNMQIEVTADADKAASPGCFSLRVLRGIVVRTHNVKFRGPVEGLTKIQSLERPWRPGPAFSTALERTAHEVQSVSTSGLSSPRDGLEQSCAEPGRDAPCALNDVSESGVSHEVAASGPKRRL